MDCCEETASRRELLKNMRLCAKRKRQAGDVDENFRFKGYGKERNEQGISGTSSKESISNLSIISSVGMKETDQTIYSIMTESMSG